MRASPAVRTIGLPVAPGRSNMARMAEWMPFCGDALRLSTHAVRRMQQRAVPTWVVRLLLARGEERPAGHGAVELAFSSRLLQRIAGDSPDIARRLDRWRNAYVVVSGDGTVQTVARRRGRFRRTHD